MESGSRTFLIWQAKLVVELHQRTADAATAAANHTPICDSDGSGAGVLAAVEEARALHVDIQARCCCRAV